MPTRIHDKLDEIDARWGSVIQVVLGVVVLIVCAATLKLAFEVKNQGDETDRRSEITAKQSKLACERSQKFGPALAVAYARYRILTPEQIEAYKATIPKKC